MQLWRRNLAICLLGAGSIFTSPSLAEEQSFKTWNLLGAGWKGGDPLEFMTIEWEYFMIHDYEGKFNGALGYVMTNPQAKGGFVGKVMPRGGNVAIGGQFHGGKALGEYLNFGIEGTKYNVHNRNTYLRNDESGHWASLEVNEGESPAMHLRGRTEKFAWDLQVASTSKDIIELSKLGTEAFLPVTDDTNVGRLPNETWTVDAVWPRTKVMGTITLLSTGEVISVNGKGYRENSWGRYAMPLDGWDFLVFSEYEENGVVAMVQTYHHSKTLDYLDLSFHDRGELKLIRFQGANKAFKWKHNTWKFNDLAHQCVPLDWDVVAENSEYRVSMKAEIDAFAQEPFLSNATIGTRIFFIHEQYPKIVGRIFRKSDNSLVKEFSGQAGGEFAVHKRFFNKISDEECNSWGRKFSN